MSVVFPLTFFHLTIHLFVLPQLRAEYIYFTETRRRIVKGKSKRKNIAIVVWIRGYALQVLLFLL